MIFLPSCGNRLHSILNKVLFNQTIRGLNVLLLSFLVSHPSYTDNHELSQPIDNKLRQQLLQAVEESESFSDRFDAEVWLTAMSHKLQRFVKDPQERLRMLRLIHREAKKAQLEPELVLAVIEIESAFDPYAVSRVGAQGMMQVMPFWKKEIGRPDDNLIHLETNLRYGCAILKYYINKEDGRIANALARYNGSYGSYKYSRKVMDAWLDHWR